MTPIRLRVRELREAKALSQSELARIAGLRRATLADLEAGKTSGVDFDTLEKLAIALGVDAGFLIVHDGPPSKR